MPIDFLHRRELLLVGGALLLGGCEVRKPHDGFLGRMEDFDERLQRGLFRAGSRGAATRPDDLTPLSAFPRYKIGEAFPRVPDSWQLEVGGMVARPLRLSLSELQKLPRTDMRVRHHCVEGWSAVASWHGVRLSEIAAWAGVDTSAPFVEFVSFEEAPANKDADAKSAPKDAPTKALASTYTSSWDRESAMHPETLLAFGMNGEPLRLEHGGPVRLYSSTKLGYKMVKWLSAVRFLPQKTGGYWEDQGYEWYAGV